MNQGETANARIEGATCCGQVCRAAWVGRWGCRHRDLAVDDVDFAAGVVHVVRQVKLFAGRQVFALPRGGKTRTVPLPESVARSLEQHIAQQPPTGVSLPWRSVDGPPVTASVLFRTSRDAR
ncbi:hypothetical protein [Streptomyces sp. NBC_00316]|uniref:hypothetical protein n=1 Tax=Streptomyces sp. NBC_00316 TaxID=2975710 RepID=UPI002E2AB540|nr:hypothetical protein [Streptomyces sp. NBC_00316]